VDSDGVKTQDVAILSPQDIERTARASRPPLLSFKSEVPTAWALAQAAAESSAQTNQTLAGYGKSRDFGKMVMKRARSGNPGLIKSTGYEGAKTDELGWKQHRPTFSAAC
jgi:hypothetical protein